MPDVHVFSTLDDANAALADFIVRLSDAAGRDRGRFTVALSGGSTPRGLYELLASPPWSGEIEWERWQVFWSDERCVPPDHPDSNYAMAKRALLDRVPVPAANVHRVRGEDDSAVAADIYEAEVRAYVGPLPVFDLILLGLGEDGHTASLFPDGGALYDRLRLVVATQAPNGGWRVTFTPPLINAARQAAFLVSGAAKASVAGAVVGATAPTTALPASLVAPTDGRLHWFLTADAARNVRR